MEKSYEIVMNESEIAFNPKKTFMKNESIGNLMVEIFYVEHFIVLMMDQKWM
jgi:hypothetical protein